MKMNLLMMCLAVVLLLSVCGLPRAEIRLEADGSGDHPSLKEAVERARKGDTILLGPGTYRLADPLDISKPLRLVGVGMDQTEIVSEAESYVVRFSGDGVFAAEDITFRHEGRTEASAVVVEGGEVAFARCRFTGSVNVGEEGKSGLWLQGTTTGVVRDCAVVENDLGIGVGEQAQPTLEGNVCTENIVGITYAGNAGGVARQNECSRNGIGIDVREQAQPTLEGNVCTNNGLGIIIDEQAQPTLEGNVCTDNGIAGITYAGNTGGVARQNECSKNEMGIGVSGQAQPRLEGNVCTDNGLGMVIYEQAQPTLEGNVCTNNEVVGISYAGNAGGVARQNKCSGNGVAGINIREQAQPTLEGNICIANKEYGIGYFDNASGVARQNGCSGNRMGIYVAETADPDLVDNDCHNNTQEDILDRRQFRLRSA